MNKTVETKQVPEIHWSGKVTVCAWCYPALTIFADYPWLKGRQLSHGICKAHLALQLVELKQNKTIINIQRILGRL